MQTIVGTARIWPCPITRKCNSKILVTVKVTATVLVIAVIATAESVAIARAVKALQRLARSFAQDGDSPAPVHGGRPSSGAPSAGGIRKPEPVHVSCHHDHPSLLPLPWWQHTVKQRGFHLDRLAAQIS